MPSQALPSEDNVNVRLPAARRQEQCSVAFDSDMTVTSTKKGQQLTTHDNRESAADAKLGFRILQREFRRFEKIMKRADSLEVVAGSALAGDRNAAQYNPVPDLIQVSLNVALDHLHALQVSTEESGGKILAMSSYTLIRTAFEAAGTGLWILQPSSRDKRLLRAMQLTYDNRRQLRTVQAELGKPDPGFDRMHARLREQMEERPGLADESEKSLPPVTERLKSISPMLPDLRFPPLTFWRMASGIAHGNSSMMIGVLEREQLSPSIGRSATYQVTSSVISIATFYKAALDTIEALVDLYDSRNISSRS